MWLLAIILMFLAPVILVYSFAARAQARISVTARHSPDEQRYTPTGCFAPTGTGISHAYRSAFSPRTMP